MISTQRFPHPPSISWEVVGTVTAMNVHPLKSARGIPVSEGTATPTGLVAGQYTDR